jgi:hypothetical protein
MQASMKVRVTKADDNTWYKVGETHEVHNHVLKSREGEEYYPAVDSNNSWGIAPSDCEPVVEYSYKEGDSLECINNVGCEDILFVGETYEFKYWQGTLACVGLNTFEHLDRYRRYENTKAFNPARFKPHEWKPLIPGTIENHQELHWHSLEGDVEIMQLEKELVQDKEAEQEYTGKSVSYYKVFVDHPTSEGVEPYYIECNDIIEALNLSFAEGNVLKSLFRRAVARKYGITKKGYDDGLYDAEKMVFFSERVLKQEQQ